MEHVGQWDRSNNIANFSIYANTTALNMGAHGAGTPGLSEKQQCCIFAVMTMSHIVILKLMTQTCE